jgi:integrase
MKHTLHEWVKLTDRNMFLAVGLELAAGLRKGEVVQCTWGMLSRDRNGALLDGRGAVKNCSGRFLVPPIDPYWSVLLRRIEKEGWRGKNTDPVLLGTITETSDCTFRNIGAWMRGLGWKTQKTNHALRAWSGSLVAMKFGIYRASAWLRHSSVKVTESHYTHFLNERVFRPEEVRIRWAK